MDLNEYLDLENRVKSKMVATNLVSTGDENLLSPEMNDINFRKRQLEKLTVTLFTKLKKGGFIIDTPYGEYSPDWAVVVKEDTTHDHKMYFIVETKIDKNEEDLSDVERQKIRLGKLHFRAVDDNLLKYDWVNSYKNYKEKFKIIEV